MRRFRISAARRWIWVPFPCAQWLWSASSRLLLFFLRPSGSQQLLHVWGRGPRRRRRRRPAAASVSCRWCRVFWDALQPETGNEATRAPACPPLPGIRSRASPGTTPGACRRRRRLILWRYWRNRLQWPTRSWWTSIAASRSPSGIALGIHPPPRFFGIRSPAKPGARPRWRPGLWPKSAESAHPRSLLW